MDPFIGQIILFAGNFAPRSWALCDGQLLPITNYSALFSILGTTYGGDGVTTFALPDLRSRVPVHAGQGAGLSPYSLGAKGGSETVTLTSAQIPAHRHALNGVSSDGTSNQVADNALGNFGSSAPPSGPYSADTPNAEMSASAIGSTGGSQAHANVQPYLALNYIIALEGLYPSRS